MTKVPKTVGASFGQGVSRRSYQVARGLGQKGTGAPGTVPTPKPVQNHVPSPATGGGGVASGIRDYPKNGGPNIAYSSREMNNPNIQTLSKAPGGNPPPLPMGMRRVAKGLTL